MKLDTEVFECGFLCCPLQESGMNIEDYLSYILQSAISIVIEKVRLPTSADISPDASAYF